jgi:methionyl-tRNA formyltransferase
MSKPDLHNVMNVSPINVVFFGTPDYAVPSLLALDVDARYELSLVVTQPDRPAGRGRRLTAPPVKIAAEELGLHVYQPPTLRSAEMREPLAEAGADVFVVAAYGLIFGGKTRAIPGHGCVNLHASLLPKYRGASPIAAAILAGDRQTGVTMMLMDAGIDTGATLDRTAIDIEGDDTTMSLGRNLAIAGADLLVSGLDRYVLGDLKAMPQPDQGASLTRMLTKADGRIDWNEPAVAVERQVRAMWDWPRAWTTAGETILQIHASSVVDQVSSREPGQVLLEEDRAIVACGKGGLALDVVQPPGGRAMPGSAWIAGLRGSLPRLGGGEAFGPREPLIVEL